MYKSNTTKRPAGSYNGSGSNPNGDKSASDDSAPGDERQVAQPLPDAASEAVALEADTSGASKRPPGASGQPDTEAAPDETESRPVAHYDAASEDGQKRT